jgi:hypothetical protein
MSRFIKGEELRVDPLYRRNYKNVKGPEDLEKEDQQMDKKSVKWKKFDKMAPFIVIGGLALFYILIINK